MRGAQLSAVSFQPKHTEAERNATCQLDGHRPTLSLEPDGWLVASIPLAGVPVDLLRRQAAIHNPAKVTAGLCLRVELPFEKKIDGSFVAMRSALERGLAVLTGKNSAAALETHDPEDTGHMLADYCASDPRDWLQEGPHFLLQVETDRFVQKIVAEAGQGCIRAHSDLVSLHDPEPICLRALVHFLLVLNSRLRLARGSLLQDRVALEVILPTWCVHPALMNKAIDAFMIGARVAKRECAALLQPAVAHMYWAFHEERRSQQWSQR